MNVNPNSDLEIYDPDLLYNFLIDGFYLWIQHCHRFYAVKPEDDFDPKSISKEMLHALARKNELVSRIFCAKGLRALDGDPGNAGTLFLESINMSPETSQFSDAHFYMALLQKIFSVGDHGVQYLREARKRDPILKLRLPDLMQPFKDLILDKEEIKNWLEADS